MIRVIAYILIIGGLALGWFALGSIISFAHFHIDWICEAGNELISESTPFEKADYFKNECLRAENQRMDIFSTVYRFAVFSGLFGVILIIIGFQIKSRMKFRRSD